MFKNSVADKSLLKGIFYMGFGTIIAQTINVLIQPVLTRIVPAEDLGIYTFVVSLANIIIPIASLKMEMLIVSEGKDRKAQYIADVCVIINCLISILFLIVLLFGYAVGTNVINKYGPIVFLAPVLVFTNGLRFIFISYNNRYKEYELITKVSIVREAIRATIQLLSGLFAFGALGQIMGYALSPLFGMYYQSKDYFKSLITRKTISIHQFKDILSEGKGQILYLVPGQFINSFSSSLITITITSLYSATVLGHYSAGVRLLEIPILFITLNVNKVCYQRFSEYHTNKQVLTKTLFQLLVWLATFSFIIFGLIYLFAPRITEIVFGQGYGIAGVYIKQLCLMYGIRMVATSFNGLFTIFKKQYYELILNIIILAIAIGAYFVSKACSFDITSYLSIIGIGYASVYLVLLLSYIIICKTYDKTIIHD